MSKSVFGLLLVLISPKLLNKTSQPCSLVKSKPLERVGRKATGPAHQQQECR